MNTLIDTINWRYATKKFNANAKIPATQWLELEEAFRLSPSSLGLQAWHFIVIDSPQLRKELCEVSYGQSQVQDCSHYVVLCARRDIEDQDLSEHIARKQEILGLSAELAASMLERYRSFSSFWGDPATMKCYLESQVHLASGFLCCAAASMRIDTCVLGGIIPEQYDRILQLENTRYRAVLGMAFGYRSSEDYHAQEPKVRYDAKHVIEHR